MLVSVIIPTHNRRELVVEALRSVAAQEVPADEVIVIDDGSSDGSAAQLLLQFGPTCRLLRTPQRGAAAARNFGVAQARGELIAFIDSDDLWLPGKIAAQKEFFAENPAAQICQTDEIWIRNGVRVNSCTHHRKPNGDVFHPSLERCLVSPSAVMMRRSLFERVGGFNESLAVCEDYDLWLRIGCTTPVWLLDEALVVKRGGHADQLSRQHWGMDRFRVASLLDLLVTAPLSEQQRSDVVATIRRKCTILAGGARKRGDLDAAERYTTLANWADGSTASALQTGATLAA